MSKKLIVFLSVLLSGCSATTSMIDRGDYKVETSSASLSQNERVRFLVFHYTAVDDAESLRLLTQGAVSAHYLIPSKPEYQGDKPVVLQLVPEEKRAWHAGSSDWNGRSNINDTSIGIEIVNLGFTEDMLGKQWYPYSAQQVDLLVRMSKDIIKRYDITPDNVVGHSDIAPTRKSDPGPLFPWKRLAKEGIGAWPDDVVVKKYLADRAPKQVVDVKKTQEALSKYGYKIPVSGHLDKETLQVISAFQMHFRPDDISGTPDAQTEALALALVEKYRAP